MNQPLVTVICLCYNQGRFVKEAIDSVLSQTYKPIQLIVIDDTSNDNSREIIESCLIKNCHFEFIPLDKNIGNCKAFNIGLLRARGDFIIDLAADDILLPDRISSGINTFATNPAIDVICSDAELIDENNNHLSFHSDRFPHTAIPQGTIYAELIQRYFICSPTLMFKKQVIDQLGGYDESLSYEDFDFLIRTARTFSFRYVPEVLVKKRIVTQSLSNQQFKFRSDHQKSTYAVCKKIFALNRSLEERKALSHRIAYEIRLNARLFNILLCAKYVSLLMRNLLMPNMPNT